MKVMVFSSTLFPENTISLAAGVCYGKRDMKWSRIVNCWKRGHMGVFEHASVSFLVEGVSRACTHQIVRHRLASFCEESKRYVEMDIESDDWYVVPPSIEADPDTLANFKRTMRWDGVQYKEAIERGIKREDARYLLPDATKTSIFITMNLRELFHFFDLRTDKAAQWEIREMAWNMYDACESNLAFKNLVRLWKEGRDEDGRAHVLEEGDRLDQQV